MVRSECEIDELISAAQRAYAEKDMCQLRLGELARKLEDECAVIDQRMAECDEELEQIESEMRQRDAEVEEVQRETAAALAEVQREERAREDEMEHFASVRNERLQLERSVEEMFAALGVTSLADLLDTHKGIAAKLLSLWQKQAEQEAEVEKLEHEIRSIQARHRLHHSVQRTPRRSPPLSVVVPLDARPLCKLAPAPRAAQELH